MIDREGKKEGRGGMSPLDTLTKRSVHDSDLEMILSGWQKCLHQQ